MSFLCFTFSLSFIPLLPQCSVLTMVLKQKACHLHAPHLHQSWPFMHGTDSHVPKPEVCGGLPLLRLTLWLPQEGRDGISLQLPCLAVAKKNVFHGNYFGSGSFVGSLKEPKVCAIPDSSRLRKPRLALLHFLRWKMKSVRPRHATSDWVETCWIIRQDLESLSSSHNVPIDNDHEPAHPFLNAVLVFCVL